MNEGLILTVIFICTIRHSHNAMNMTPVEDGKNIHIKDTTPILFVDTKVLQDEFSSAVYPVFEKWVIKFKCLILNKIAFFC